MTRRTSMLSQELKKAREFEAQYGPFIRDSHRPAFHLTPPSAG